MATSKFAWPAWLPAPEQTQYTMQPTDRRTKTDMEIGGINRVEFDTDEATANCQLTLDEFQAAWFEAFEANLLLQGSIWITMPIWVAGQLKEHVVMFKERPKISSVVGLHTVYSFVLQISKRDLMNADTAELLLYYIPQDIMDLSDRLNIVVNVTMPGVTILPDNPIWS